MGHQIILSHIIENMRLIKPIGQGGMSFVYLAENMKTKEKLAIKVLKANRAEDQQFLDLFLTEADVSRFLDHPNLIKTRKVGQYHGNYYLIMDYFEGMTLDALILRHKTQQHTLSWKLAAYIVLDILSVLDYLHHAGDKNGEPLQLVHRDITPHNVFINENMKVMVGDLGATHIASHGTMMDHIAIGKLAYIAPEVLTGEDFNHTADIFSLGIVFWEMLTLERLFYHPNEQETISRIMHKNYPLPSSKNSALGKDKAVSL